MNSFDTIWEKVHSEKEWGKYPPEELVRFIMGNFKHLSYEERKKIKVLELGSGQGANIWFLSREGFDAFGIDGSKSAVEKTYKRLKSDNLTADLITGDFNDLSSYKDESFDIIIDIAALETNRLKNVSSILKQCSEKLKPGGKIFSMMIAQGSFGDNLGKKIEEHTFTDIKEGPFAGVGLVRFFDEDEVNNIFSIFNNVNVEYSIRSMCRGNEYIKHWIISASK